MQNKPDDGEIPLRDGTESLPEQFDTAVRGADASEAKDDADELVQEALLESFPASDPPASGHMTPDLRHLSTSKDDPHE